MGIKIKGRQTSYTEMLCIFALFMVFATLAIFTVISGARAYSNISEKMHINDSVRMSVAYVTTKIHHADKENISVKDGALSITETEADGTVYETKIYQYGDSLYELYSENGINLPKEAGIELMKLNSFKVSLGNDGLFQIDIESETGKKISASVAAR